ncbi:MAG: M16 family metallopeptidase, partial [Candidatus Syntrophosphaera sp.]
EKDIIIEELKQTENEPESDFLEFVQASGFLDSPLKKPIPGTVRSVRGATHAKLRRFHARYYQPQNSFLVIAGDVEPDKLSGHVAELFQDWQNTTPLEPRDLSRYLEPGKPPASTLWRKKPQQFLAYLLPELCDSHPASDALLIAMRHLAVGRSSRLFKRLVEEEKIASSVKVISFSGIMSGVSAILVNPAHNNHVNKIHTIFLREYQALLEGSLDPGEFELIKKDIINSWRYGFEGMENLAEMIGAEEFIDGYEKLYVYDRQIQPITLEDVKRSVKRYWQPENLMLIHQSPRDADFAIRIKLANRRNGSSRLTTLTHEDSPARAPEIVPKLSRVAPDHYSAILPNGMRFLYHRQPGRPISGFALATDVCQLSETPSQRGLNYLCSAAMLHSTARRAYSEILRTCREHGISINVTHQTDGTIFRGKCFHTELPTALGILAELVSLPAFEAEHIRLLKMAALDMLRRDMQNPASYGYLRFLNMLFGPNHPYGQYSGRITELKKHNREDVLEWYQSQYDTRRYSLAVVGADPPDEALRAVSAMFTAHPGKSAPRKWQAHAPAPLKTRQIKAKKDSGQAIIHLGGFAPPAKDRRAATAFHVLTQVLGGDMDSRLFNILREKYGFAYQTGFEYSCVRNQGHWFVYAYCDLADHKPALKLIREILQGIRENGVTPQELLHAQNYLCGTRRFELESASLQAMLISSLSAAGYETDYYLKREERIRAVSLADLKSLAEKWLSPQNQWTHILL